MDILEKLMKYKYHVIFTLIISLIAAGLIFIAPSFITILAYFWPLFVSTALFLGAVVLFGKTALPGTEASGDKAAEGLLDYVAGEPEPLVDNFKSE